MISKKHFLEQIKKLNVLFPDSALSDQQVAMYYEVLSQDFNDAQFDEAFNLAVKNSFKFPPIAAFYRKDTEAQYVPSPVTPEFREQIRLARERVANG